MANAYQTSTLSTPATLTLPSEGPPSPGRTSSMPDESRYTARMRKLRDRVPPHRPALIFTGANSQKNNLRLSRLAPPKGSYPINPRNVKSPGYYGGDSRKYEKRTSRYLDSRKVGIRKGGAPIFSGSSGTTYEARMMRLEDRH